VSECFFGRRVAPVCAAVLVLAAMSGTAQSRSLNTVEKAALSTAVAALNTAMQNGNFDYVVGNMPPKMVHFFAANSNVPIDEFRQNVIRKFAEMKSSGVLESYVLDLSTAQTKELPNGMPYVLLPTTTIMQHEGKHYKSSYYTIALLDGGKWYTDRIGKEMALLQAYPEFAGVEFPQGTTEIVDHK